jgi:hypothetical protein
LLIWGLPDYPISNVVFKSVNLVSSSSSTSGIYNATNIQFIDCSLPVPAGNRTVQLWNAAVIFTNSSASTNQYLLDGLTTNGIGNTLAFYNMQASLKNTNAVAAGAVTIAGSTFTISNNLTMIPSPAFSFSSGTNTALVAVKGNLQLGGTVNISAGSGFTNGNYVILTYAGSLTGTLPTLGTVPSGFNCSINTNTAGQVKLIVSPQVNGTTTNIMYQVVGGTGTGGALAVSWPSDHTGWRLQIQTNDPAAGLGTNWFDVVGSTSTNQVLVPIDPRNGSVFLRLVY